METIKQVLEFLSDSDVREHPFLQLYAELYHMDEHIDLSQWTEEDKNRLKERLIECRYNMLWDNLQSIRSVRNELKIPKERFWWYMDEL